MPKKTQALCEKWATWDVYSKYNGSNENSSPKTIVVPRGLPAAGPETDQMTPARKVDKHFPRETRSVLKDDR
jgi:hypothetical protein